MKSSLSKHIKWVASVGQDVLSQKCLAVEDYANHLSEGEIPVDPFGLLCIARNWYIDIAVFLKTGIQTTRCDTLENVSIHLLYTGGSTFFDTCVQQPLRQSILPQSSDDKDSTLDLEDMLTGCAENENKKSSIHTGTDGTKDTSFANDMAAGTKDTLFTSVDSGTKSASSSKGTRGGGHGQKCKRRSSSTGPRPKKRRVIKPRNQKNTANKFIPGLLCCHVEQHIQDNHFWSTLLMISFQTKRNVVLNQIH